MNELAKHSRFRTMNELIEKLASEHDPAEKEAMEKEMLEDAQHRIMSVLLMLMHPTPNNFMIAPANKDLHMSWTLHNPNKLQRIEVTVTDITDEALSAYQASGE
jgi:hypothetical protein